MTPERLGEIEFLAQRESGRWEPWLEAMAEAVPQLLAEVRTLATQLAEMREERDGALGYATRLFQSLAPQCQPLEKLAHVLTQIDNWIVGERDRADRADAALRKYGHHLYSCDVQKGGAYFAGAPCNCGFAEATP